MDLIALPPCRITPSTKSELGHASHLSEYVHGEGYKKWVFACAAFNARQVAGGLDEQRVPSVGGPPTFKVQVVGDPVAPQQLTLPGERIDVFTPVVVFWSQNVMNVYAIPPPPHLPLRTLHTRTAIHGRR